MKYGKLTALYPTGKNSEGRRVWRCLCSCGNTRDVSAKALRRRQIKSCTNCASLRKDVSGMQFGWLTVLYPTNINSKYDGYIWHCRCKCGNEIDVPIHRLTTGTRRSCGCACKVDFDALIGTRFGMLTIQSVAPRNKGERIRYECICDCGRTKTILRSSLISGKTTSCGNHRKLGKDLTGMTVGHLTVLERTTDKLRGKCFAYRCRCFCGNEIIVSRSSLIYGHKKSCGCLSNRKPEDLTGMTFNNLTVLYPDRSETEGRPGWICRCSCGREKFVRANYLISGKVKSCGCIVSAGKNLTGQRFGHLTAMERTDQKAKSGTYLWRCKCDCGQEVLASVTQLTSGMKQSCGCL